MKIAVCDLGTNMWRLRIVDLSSGAHLHATTDYERLQTVLHNSISERSSVFMGRERTDFLTEATLERCKTVLMQFKTLIEAQNVEKIWIAGTAGFRNATNSETLVHWAKSALGLHIEVISGDREANLLGKGIRAALNLLLPTAQNALFVDIGGGSVEYIISDKQRSIWARSYPIGVGTLFNIFGKTTALRPSEIAEIEAFINDICAELRPIIAQNKVQHLAITAGGFGVLYKLLGAKQNDAAPYDLMSATDFARVYDYLMPQSLDELYANPSIPAHRAEMFSMFLILVKNALDSTACDAVITPYWSMEEAMLLEITRN